MFYIPASRCVKLLPFGSFFFGEKAQFLVCDACPFFHVLENDGLKFKPQAVFVGGMFMGDILMAS